MPIYMWSASIIHNWKLICSEIADFLPTMQRARENSKDYVIVSGRTLLVMICFEKYYFSRLCKAHAFSDDMLEKM